jgi:hypothetical protein
MRAVTGTLAACVAVGTCFASSAGAQIDSGAREPRTMTPPLRVSKDPTLDSQLAAVAAAAERGTAAGLEAARSGGLVTSSGKVQVVVEAAPADARSAVAALGGAVEAVSGGLTEALVPATAVRRLGDARGIDYVRAPAPARALGIDSEGVAASSAAAWHAAGATGAGAKVAVIDLGFASLADRQATGDLPVGLTTVDHCGGTMGAPEKHGTAVAEIVHEMAPAAALTLICVDSEVDLANAAAYAQANGITIVNHSVGWFNTARGDGTGAPGTPDAIVASARAQGILWVNAAGNSAQGHWSGTYSDSDADGLHDFAPGDDGNTLLLFAGEQVCGLLKWDSWPGSSQDYDLYLGQDSTFALIAGSENVQSGTQKPTEALCYTNATGVAQNFSFLIARFSASATPRFDLFVTIGGALQYRNAGGSVIEPATSPSALAVGAICWLNNAWETYSSVGPTIDGRIKPDIAAPSAVTSAIYGPFTACGVSGFTGTSSAAPHVAGAAALLRGMFPLATVGELQSWLEADALDLGVLGKDSTFGAGKLRLPTSAPLVTTFLPSPAVLPTHNSFDVSGSVSPLGLVTTYHWEYGPTTSYGSQTASLTLASPRTGQTVATTLTGLLPDTLYHYRLVATNLFGTASGDDRTNHTTPALPPSVTTKVPEDVGANNARLSALITPNGTITSAWFEWGTTTAYGNETAHENAGASPVGTAAELAGLLPNTEYHYRAVASNVHGLTAGLDRAFTTSGSALPSATTGATGFVSMFDALLNGEIIPNGLPTSYYFEYGTSPTGVLQQTGVGAAGYGTTTRGVMLIAADLQPGTLYQYRLVATNALGTSRGDFKAFTTLAPAPPPPPPSGGGGGGGGGSLNLGVTLSAAKTTLVPNETVEIQAVITHKSGGFAATQVRALIALPAGSTLSGPPAVDRGSGCIGTENLDCNLDFMMPAMSTIVRFSINVGAAGTKTLNARLTQQETDADASDSTATVTFDVHAPFVPPSSGSGGATTNVVNGTSRADRLRGSARRDIIRGFAGNDELLGLGGDDRLFGGAGNDRLVGGAGRDLLDAGLGSDTIVANDKAKDTIRCGPGRDSVVADRADIVARDCETVRRR